MQDPSIGWGLVTTTHERREGSRQDLVTFAIFSSDQLTAEQCACAPRKRAPAFNLKVIAGKGED